MICWSIKQEFNNLSWNSKCPSSNTIKCHGPFEPQALLTSTWLISTSSLPSKHCCSHGGCPFFKSHLWPNSPMPQACLINIMTLFFHRNVELINHQRSSSKTEMTLQPSCFSNSPPMMKSIWEDSWKDHCTWKSLSSQTSTQSLSTKFVTNIVFITAI